VKVDLPNLYTPSTRFSVDSEAQLEIDGARYIQPVLVKGGYPEDQTWRMRIALPQGKLAKLRDFKNEVNHPQQWVLLSVNGRPVEVGRMGGLGIMLLVGAFESRAEIEDFVGRSVSNEVFEVELDGSYEEEVERVGRQFENANRRLDQYDHLLEAMKAEDVESVKRLEERLKKELAE
jgi:hypothetical protein